MIEVTKSGVQILENLTNEEIEVIKKELTLNNPAYEQVKKFSRYSYTNVHPYLTYFEQVDGKLIVPRGYTIPFEHKIIKDERVDRKVLYPKFKLELRDTQQEAYNAWKSDKEKGMIVLPTGKGKSVLGAYLAYATKQRVLIIVHKLDLIDGWTKDIEMAYGIKKSKIGLIRGKEFRIGKQYTLATIQTLSKLDESVQRELFNTFGMIIVDEAHRVSAKSYDILKYFKAKYLIGLTATDMRGDGLDKTMYWAIGDVAFRAKEDKDDEDIMPYTVKLRYSNIEYNPPEQFYYGKHIVGADEAEQLRRAGKNVKRKPLDAQELRQLLKDKQFNYLVARDIYKEYTRQKSCIAFLHEKEHIRYLRDVLVSLGVKKEQIQLYYGDAKEDDSIMKERAEKKEVLITLATFAKATEGTNVKSWEVAFLVTSINNVKNTIQAVGRIRRRKEGKDECIVYDYVHPKVTGMRNHIKTRMKAYNMTNAKIIGYKDVTKGIISRGWKRKEA